MGWAEAADNNPDCFVVLAAADDLRVAQEQVRGDCQGISSTGTRRPHCSAADKIREAVRVRRSGARLS